MNTQHGSRAVYAGRDCQEVIPLAATRCTVDDCSFNDGKNRCTLDSIGIEKCTHGATCGSDCANYRKKESAKK